MNLVLKLSSDVVSVEYLEDMALITKRLTSAESYYDMIKSLCNNQCGEVYLSCNGTDVFKFKKIGSAVEDTTNISIQDCNTKERFCVSVDSSTGKLFDEDSLIGFKYTVDNTDIIFTNDSVDSIDTEDDPIDIEEFNRHQLELEKEFEQLEPSKGVGPVEEDE